MQDADVLQPGPSGAIAVEQLSAMRQRSQLGGAASTSLSLPAHTRQPTRPGAASSDMASEQAATQHGLRQHLLYRRQHAAKAARVSGDWQDGRRGQGSEEEQSFWQRQEEAQALWLRARREDQAAWEAALRLQHQEFLLRQAQRTQQWQLERMQEQQRWERHRQLQQELWERWKVRQREEWATRHAQAAVAAGAAEHCAPVMLAAKRWRGEDGDEAESRPAPSSAATAFQRTPAVAEASSQCGGRREELARAAAHDLRLLSPLGPGAPGWDAAPPSSPSQRPDRQPWAQMSSPDQPPSDEGKALAALRLQQAAAAAAQAGDAPLATRAQLVEHQQQWCEAAQHLLAALKSGQRLEPEQVRMWKQQQEWLMSQKQAWEALQASLPDEPRPSPPPEPRADLSAQPALSVGNVGSATHAGGAAALVDTSSVVAAYKEDQDWWLSFLDA